MIIIRAVERMIRPTNRVLHYRVVITELGYLRCNLKADQSKYYVPV